MFLVMVVGLVGTILPIVPGLPLIVGAAVVYGMVEGFGVAGWAALVVIAALGVAGTVAGFVLPQRAAGGAGATSTSMLLGAVGAIVGFFAVPVVGMPLGGALGIYLGERGRGVDHAQAWVTMAATMKAFGIGALVQLAAGILMVLAFVVWLVAT